MQHLTTDVVIALINFGGILFGGFIGLLSRRKLQQLHIEVNSRLDKLLALARESGFQEGQAHARAERAVDAAVQAATATAVQITTALKGGIDPPKTGNGDK